MSWDAPIPIAPRRIPVRPSPVFLGLVALMVAAGVYLWTRPNQVATSIRIGMFVFVAVGWIVSLCLHEFNHAAMAWYAGDTTVEAKGYLTLDPRRYMNRQLSIVLPIIMVLIGGIGLPGGAVMIDRRLTPSKWRRAMVSAAGPLTNLTLAIACSLPLALHWVGGRSGAFPASVDLWAFHRHAAFASALAFLALLQFAVTVINSLPIPGLDGFGVIAPFLPEETVRSAMPIANYAFLGLFLILIYSAKANNAFFTFCFNQLAHLGVPRSLAEQGQVLFTFWRKV